jgi:hypothetical protein
MTKQIPIAFEPQGIVVPITQILPLKQIKPAILSSQKYQQVLSSVLEVGIIEPLIIFPENGRPNPRSLPTPHRKSALSR